MHFCVQTIFVWMTTAVNCSCFSLQGRCSHFFCEERNTSSSTCALWVTVSMSAICRMAFFLYCGVFGVGLRNLFLILRPSSVLSSCVKSATSVHASVKPNMPRLLRCALFSHSSPVWWVCTAHFLSLCVCVYNPRPFKSTTWIHPISWLSWLQRPLITEGPARSNRCASWLFLSPTTVARNLCGTQCTGACHRRGKSAGAQKQRLDFPVWTGVCVYAWGFPLEVLLRNCVRSSSSERIFFVR